MEIVKIVGFIFSFFFWVYIVFCIEYYLFETWKEKRNEREAKRERVRVSYSNALYYFRQGVREMLDSRVLYKKLNKEVFSHEGGNMCVGCLDLRKSFYERAWDIASEEGLGEVNLDTRWCLHEIGLRLGLAEDLFTENYLQCIGKFAAFTLLARVAKLDCNVSEEKIEVAERLFDDNGFSIPEDTRGPYKEVFNRTIAKPGGYQDIFEDAKKIAHPKAGIDDEKRIFIYNLLWAIACADGVLAKNEKGILEGLCSELGVAADLFRTNYELYQYLVLEEVPRQAHNVKGYETAYATLGVPSDATDEEVKEAYRRSAKLYHEDILRANGASEETICFARQRMRDLNEAWEEICKVRGL